MSKIRYRIGKDGKVKLTVIDGDGENCLKLTEKVEEALGRVEEREFTEDYHREVREDLNQDVREQERL